MNEQAPGTPRDGLRWWHGVAMFAAALGAQLGIVVLITLVSMTGLLGSSPDEVQAAMAGPAMLAVQVLMTCAMLTLLALAGTRIRKAGARRTMRLGRPGTAALVIAGLGVIPAGIVADEVTFLLHTASPTVFDAEGLGAFVESFAEFSTGGFVLATIAVTVGPALGEELFFRGLVLRSARADLPAWGAVALSSFLFGVLHMDMLQGTGAGVIGVYLGVAALMTGSIWPAVLGHGVNNLLCSLFARLDPEGVGQAFNVGHPPWLVGAAALLTAAVVFDLSRLRAMRAEAPPAAAR